MSISKLARIGIVRTFCIFQMNVSIGEWLKGCVSESDVRGMWEGLDEGDRIEQLREWGVIARAGTLVCRGCSRGVLRVVRRKGKYVWLCPLASCKRSFSVYCGTILENCKTRCERLRALVCFLWNVSNQYTVIATKLSPTSVSSDFSYFAKIIVEIMKGRPNLMIGGEGHQVQIDESCVSKRKYHRGRLKSNQKWIFGGIDQQTKQCFFVDVARRNRNTLVPIILDKVLRGTEIVSDGWAAYVGLDRLGFDHEVVNHSVQFVNAQGKHTNSIEALWGSLKRKIGSRHRSDELFPLALEGFVFKRECKLNQVDPFLQFLHESLPILTRRANYANYIG